MAVVSHNQKATKYFLGPGCFLIGWVFYFVNLEELFFLALLFLFKILKDKDLANEKYKTAELQEIRSRLEKESAKLGEDLRACKQEFEKVH